MQVNDYCTKGGKNLIQNYISKLPKNEQNEAYKIRNAFATDGLNALNGISTRQLEGKLWEINFLKIG